MPFFDVQNGVTTGDQSLWNQFADGLSGTNDVGAIQAFAKINPPGAPTVAVDAVSGNLTGNYQYAVAFVTGYWQGPVGSGTLHTQGNTGGGTASTTVSPNGQQVNVSNIPIGGTGVVARIVYRTKANGSTFYFLQQFNDNTTTSFTDNIPDANLGAAMPTTNTTGSYFAGDAHGLTNLPLATNSVPGAVKGNATIGINSDGTMNIGANAITNTQLAANSVGSSNIQSGAVGNAQLAANAVGTSNIQNNAVTNAQLSANSVASSNIQNGAVGNAQLALNAVATGNIQSNAVTNDKLAAKPLFNFPNLLHQDRQSFTRSTSAYRKNMEQVLSNMLRLEMGAMGKMPYIEEATTNLVSYPSFESVTGTATVFSDALTAGTTADPAWTVQAGSFTWSTSGATSGANGSLMTAGNAAWKPLVGSGGQNLALTAQATFTMPASISTGNALILRLFQDASNLYNVSVYSSTLYLSKLVNGGGFVTLASVAQTLSASTPYTATFSLDHTGALTAKLYSGTGTGGTLLQTLTATDTSLTGGFLVSVGGDTGVVISNASVTAPFADGWTRAVDNNGNGSAALTTTSIAGMYGVSIVQPAVASSATYVESDHINVGASTTYTLSAYADVQSIASGSVAGLRITEYTSANAVVKDDSVVVSLSSVTNGFQRISYTWTTQSTTANITVRAQCTVGSSGSITATFDAIQLEQKAYATSYTDSARNADSLQIQLSQPLPTRWFKGARYVLDQASATVTRTRTFQTITDKSGNVLYTVNYDGTKFNFTKQSTTASTGSISFNAGDIVTIFMQDDPTVAGQISLWVGINGGTLTQVTAASTTQITTAQVIYLGSGATTGNEINGVTDSTIITSTIPTAEQINWLYNAQTWGQGDWNNGQLIENTVIGDDNQSIARSKALIQYVDTRAASNTNNSDGTPSQYVEKDGTTTVSTINFTYSSGKCTQVQEIVTGGNTVTYTLNYDANGNFIGFSKTVV